MFFQSLFARLLRLYPVPFQEEFASEMQAVFADSLGDARLLGKRALFLLLLRELTHLPFGALLEHLQNYRNLGDRKLMSNSTPSSASQSPLPQVEPPASALTILLGLIPILLLSLATILVEIHIYLLGHRAIPALSLVWTGLVTYPILYVLILIAAGIAWYQGSPRWSYSYTGFLLVFTWYLEGFRPPGFIAAWLPYLRYAELWGKWIWLPLLVTILIVLLAKRSWLPLRRFFQNIQSDWTLYTFLLYSALPWLSWAFFDEIRNHALVVISLLVVDLSLCLGAWFYLRARLLGQRARSLFYGMLPVILVTVLATSAYWHGRQEIWMKTPGNGYADALRGFIFYAVLLLIMFFPALLSLVRHTGRSFRTA
jgi:hypothetical protein